MNLTTSIAPCIATGMFHQLVAGVGAGSVTSNRGGTSSLITDVRSKLAGNAPPR